MVICTTSTVSLPRFAGCQVWVLLLVLGLLVPAQAADAPELAPLPEMQATLERLEKQLASAGTATAQELKTLEKEIATVRSSALECVKEAEQGAEKLDSELAILRPEKPVDAKAAKPDVYCHLTNGNLC
jgi:septal ring factor EnvC (AmiA/AmiB activator)